MANKKAQRQKKHLALTVSLVGKMIEINRKGLLVLLLGFFNLFLLIILDGDFNAFFKERQTPTIECLSNKDLK